MHPRRFRAVLRFLLSNVRISGNPNRIVDSPLPQQNHDLNRVAGWHDQQGGCSPLLQTTVEPAGGTTIVCLAGGGELLKLRQPARASGKNKTNAVIFIVNLQRP